MGVEERTAVEQGHIADPAEDLQVLVDDEVEILLPSLVVVPQRCSSNCAEEGERCRPNAV